MTASLYRNVVVTVPLGLCCGAFLIAVTGDFLNALVTWFEQVFAEMNRGFVERGATDVRLVPPNATQVAGLLAAGNAALCAVSLMLARYWQALLFNPGGFGAEFRQLRLPTRWTLVLAALLLGITAASGEMGGWAVVFAVPLTLCGFALIHSWVRARGAGKPALVASYFFWVVFAPIKGVLMALVVIDSFIDFRSRWTAKEDSST